MAAVRGGAGPPPGRAARPVVTAGGEFARLARLRDRLAGSSEAVPVGVGDDAAVVRVGGAEVVVCVDALVEGVHFRRDVSSPADVGWKVVAVNVSDAAAMGAVPRAAVVVLHRPPALAERDVDALYDGMAEAARRWGVALVGGDTVAAGEWAVSLTLLADLPGPAVTRAGAVPGDVVVLAGRLGAAAAAVHALAREGGGVADVDHPAGGWAVAHLAAHRRPIALPATGRALAAAGATAMVDVSDGLGADAGHVARGGQVDLRLDRSAVEAVVADGVADAVGAGWLDLAIGGGEDFALLATVPPDRVAAAREAVAAAGEAELAVLGRVEAPDVEEPAVRLHGPGPVVRRIDHLGYDHG